MIKITSGEKVSEIIQKEVGGGSSVLIRVGMWLPQVMTDSEAHCHLAGSLV